MKRLLCAILPALLPSESREHVLGDLAERGNRTLDILSVLPRVWWRRLYHIWNPQLPPLSASSEEMFRWQLHRLLRDSRLHAILQLLPAILFLSWVLQSLWLWILFPIALAAYKLYVPSIPRPQPFPQSLVGPHTWREMYRARLERAPVSAGWTYMSYSLCTPMVRVLVFDRGGGPEHFALATMGSALIVAPIMLLLNWPWIRRVKQELRSLKAVSA